MSLEILAQVQQAEDKGQKIRQLAQQEAREVTKGSEMAIVQQEKQAAVDHRNLFGQLLETKKQEVQKKIDGQIPQYRREHQMLLEKAVLSIDEAVQVVVERIMQHGDR